MSGKNDQVKLLLPEPNIKYDVCITSPEPKRWVTAVEGCDLFGPEPECLEYKRVTRHFNCPPLTEEEWFLGAVSISTPSEETIMALKLSPVGAQSKTCERVDVLPLEIVGPAAAQDYTAMLTAALAANPAAYPTFGAAAATDEVLAFNAVEPNGGELLYNGISTAMVDDPDGVNMANTLEVPDGCTAVVTFCLQKCLTKAEIAAL